jgi:hypothetical protein
VVSSAGHGPRAPILDITGQQWHDGLDVYLMNIIRATPEGRRDHQHLRRIAGAV